MRVVKIPKGGGRFRTIYVPDPSEMAVLRDRTNRLRNHLDEFDPHGVVHAFRKGRSPVTNAAAHRGFRYTVEFDLKDFFDTVRMEMCVLSCLDQRINVRRFDFTSKDWEPCFVDGVTRQGLPSSPALSNIAAARMDLDFVAMQLGGGRFDARFVYTRYADDLTFSFDAPHLIHVLKQRVPQVVEANGFVLNEAKTRVQCARVGRRMVTGVAVDDAVHAPRAVRRRLRAALHQGRKAQASGLAEWCKCKMPTPDPVKVNGARILLRRPTIIFGSQQPQAQPAQQPVAAARVNGRAFLR